MHREPLPIMVLDNGAQAHPALVVEPFSARHFDVLPCHSGVHPVIPVKAFDASEELAALTSNLIKQPVQVDRFQSYHNDQPFDDLIDYWQGCALTRYNKIDFLIASHIKPWSVSDDRERLDQNNGFILLANIDKAFDLGYISFTEKGKIIISPYLVHYEVLGISKNMGIPLKKEYQDYLAYYREITFKNEFF